MIGLVLLILGSAGGWWMGSGSSARTQGQMQAMVVEARLEGAQTAIKTLDMRVMSAVRAGFDNAATSEAMGTVEKELSAAISVLNAADGAAPKKTGAAETEASAPEAAPTKPEPAVSAVDTRAKAIAKINRARSAAAGLAKQRGNVAAALMQLEHLGARSRSSEVDGKSLSVQRAALASLYADLSKDAQKAGNSKRAARYLEVAKTVNPKSGPRYDKHRGKDKVGPKGPGKRGPGKKGSGKKQPAAPTPGMKR